MALTFAAMLGGLAYLPIREAASDLKQSVGILADKMVTQKEMKWRTARGAEDRARTDASVKELRNAQVPREELNSVFGSYDKRFVDQQRQIDEMKTAQGSVYGIRDILLDLRDRTERERLSSVQNGG
ncbi:hypothetical protein FHX08_004209 [Rhizobium sp. BK529]|uniref:hypothetical protein n=1 Tax=unclassified Rhizobium TaxID=2613769 RepID=UPI0017B15123|nr:MULTISPECIES: hypothetical protein [unclassified Rhizobium]MBB3593806.1 hypothetical protein [Rhizobium sp. BK529]